MGAILERVVKEGVSKEVTFAHRRNKKGRYTNI